MLIPNPTPTHNVAITGSVFLRVFHWLDQSYGACVLARRALRQIVEDALRHFAGERYQLGASTVMPNHVHALVTPIRQHEVSEILHSWKSFTAVKINRMLGRTGQFWQKESFDHMVRSAASLEKFAQYIRENPANARFQPRNQTKSGWKPLLLAARLRSTVTGRFAIIGARLTSHHTACPPR